MGWEGALKMPERTTPEWKSLNVLVVDDDRDTADTLGQLLRLGGHQVEVAYTGPVALLAAERHKPDVILLDLGLPRLDGYRVAETLRQLPQTKDALIIAVTGYGDEATRERCREAGFDLQLLKPVSVEKILELLRGDLTMLIEFASFHGPIEASLQN